MHTYPISVHGWKFRNSSQTCVPIVDSFVLVLRQILFYESLYFHFMLLFFITVIMSLTNKR